MLWILIAAAIILVVCIILQVTSWGGFDFEEFFWHFFFGIMIAAIPLTCVNMWGFYHAGTKTERYVTLENLGDGMGVEGSFFLGSGSVDSEPVYMYYVNDNGRYTLHHLDANRSYVTYTDSTPQLIIHGTENKNRWFCVFTGFSEDEYEFQVPRGSVKQNFNLDAQ